MTLPYALCGYSLPHVMGYLPTKAGERMAQPLNPHGLMAAAQELGLAGVEFALEARVPSFDGTTIETGAETDWGPILREKNLQLVADYGCILDHDADAIKGYLRRAADAGAKVVRAILSHLLCGDRRSLPNGWPHYRDRLAARLREVLPVAEELGLCLAVENHQDADSNDLLWLAEAVNYSPAFGVTLDTGNPLAVGEDPVEFARRIAPIIRHVHLKDYTLHFAPEGYRLVRCAAGDGVIDFPAILQIVRDNGHAVLPALETAAQATRTIPLLDPEWWTHYPARDARTLVPVLRLLWARGRPDDEPYSTAWERGEGSAAIVAEEWEAVRRSRDYFRALV